MSPRPITSNFDSSSQSHQQLGYVARIFIFYYHHSYRYNSPLDLVVHLHFFSPCNDTHQLPRRCQPDISFYDICNRTQHAPCNLTCMHHSITPPTTHSSPCRFPLSLVSTPLALVFRSALLDVDSPCTSKSYQPGRRMLRITLNPTHILYFLHHHLRNEGHSAFHYTPAVMRPRSHNCFIPIRHIARGVQREQLAPA
ncbi:hypothetical protein CRV24_010104 [Beauveria bassiana]|nr:hypothetical protein CRV24_010104 [Beauveria bassiana]